MMKSCESFFIFFIFLAKHRYHLHSQVTGAQLCSELHVDAWMAGMNVIVSWYLTPNREDSQTDTKVIKSSKLTAESLPTSCVT